MRALHATDTNPIKREDIDAESLVAAFVKINISLSASIFVCKHVLSGEL